MLLEVPEQAKLLNQKSDCSGREVLTGRRHEETTWDNENVLYFDNMRITYVYEFCQNSSNPTLKICPFH